MFYYFVRVQRIIFYIPLYIWQSRKAWMCRSYVYSFYEFMNFWVNIIRSSPVLSSVSTSVIKSTFSPLLFYLDRCPQGYHFLNNNMCGKHVEQCTNVQDAADKCALEGASLAAPQDCPTAVHLSYLARQSDIHIAKTDADVEGQWKVGFGKDYWFFDFVSSFVYFFFYIFRLSRNSEKKLCTHPCREYIYIYFFSKLTNPIPSP